MSIQLALTSETLPEGVCDQIASEQDRLNLYASHMFATFPGTLTGIAIGPTKPSDTTQAWFRTDGTLRPVGMYLFANGAWLSLHPDVPGKTILWTGALPDFTVFDGGDASAPSAYAGPMWEEVTALRAKMPIGVGTLPSTTALGVGDTGGEESHVLTQGELAPHQHFIVNTDTLSGQAGEPDLTASQYLAAWIKHVTDSETMFSAHGNDNPATVGLTSNIGGDVDQKPIGHNNLPPYVAVYFLRRTGRLFYKVA